MKSLRSAPVLAALVGLSQLTCHQVILTAPPGSVMHCDVNPTFIAANGDIAVVSVLIFDGTGSPVADGTVVQFLTNLGRIPEQAKTNDGVARVNFISDSRSGQASIRAFSGGEGGSTGTTQTTGTTVQTGPSAGSPVDASIFASAAAAAQAASMASCSVPTVTIGSSLPEFIRVTANPERITDSRTSRITATVTDARGNPVANVPLIFQSDNPTLGFMESGGAPRFTDNNGQASDIFRTRLPREGPSTPAIIEVHGPRGNLNGEVTVYIN
jgi:hypothetical protein